MDCLFFDGELRLALEEQSAKLHAAVEVESEESLRQADADEWAEALAHHFAVECPTLTGDVWMEQAQDVKIDISAFPGRRYFSDPDSELARNFPGHRVVVHVPFKGDAGVFRLRPNQFNLNPPRANIGDEELTLPIEWARDEEPNIDNEVNAFIGSVSTWLTWAEGEIKTFNANLAREAMQAITARRQRIEQRDAEIAKSSIPIRRPGESEKTHIPDVLVRRPAPSLPKTRADDEAPKLEPAIEERIFEHILRVTDAGATDGAEPGRLQRDGRGGQAAHAGRNPEHALRGPSRRRGLQLRGQDRHPDPLRGAQPLHLRVQVLVRAGGL